MASHPDLQAEQAHLDRAYARLDAMRAAVLERMRDVLDVGPGGTFQARTERDVVVNAGLKRLEQLNLGDEALCFGRIDQEDGDAFHIGRLAISGEDQEPLVVDWRAPIAEPFYRATGRHPMGLRRRRHFLVDKREIVDIEDEHFAGGGPGGEAGLGLAGTGVLLAALERGRTGRMRDIVATVQREQDEIIRAPLPGVLVVQGGPGTGKTAVALHRAAYLLYTHRFPLERQGVLVVGPNPLFLRYIEHVLPSLGETGVGLSTVDGLFPGVRARGEEPPAVSRLKGDARMVEVVANAVRDRQRALPADVTVGFGPFVLRLSRRASADVVAAGKRRPGTHNGRRRFVEGLVLRRLYGQYQSARERARRVGLRGGAGVGDDAETPYEEFAAALRRDLQLVRALDRMWPVLTPHELLHDLFGALPLLRLAGRGLLTDEECRLLHRPRSASLDEVLWTPADVPLLDEALVHLGPAKRGGPDDELRSFGHIVVDEAQDLSPLQLRMLTRRSLSGSMTVVGDVAQATGHWAPGSWDEPLRHLPQRRPPKVVELSVNYRTPAEIMAVAGKVLAEAAPHLVPPDSVRSTGEHPRFVAVGEGGLGSGVAAIVGRELGGIGTGTVAVVCPRSLVGDVGGALSAAGLSYGDGAQALDAAVTVVAVEAVKGLEFDSVVVVEPARMIREANQGMRALYVALTRATKRVTVVHAEPLPSVLT